MTVVQIAPSILSADFSALGRDIAAVERGGADLIHVDVMDGHFVPNITIGPPVVRAIKKVATRPLDVHLMIEQPDRYIEAFVDAGADMISVHVEAVPHLHRTISFIKAFGETIDWISIYKHGHDGEAENDPTRYGPGFHTVWF